MNIDLYQPQRTRKNFGKRNKLITQSQSHNPRLLANILVAYI